MAQMYVNSGFPARNIRGRRCREPLRIERGHLLAKAAAVAPSIQETQQTGRRTVRRPLATPSAARSGNEAEGLAGQTESGPKRGFVDERKVGRGRVRVLDGFFLLAACHVEDPQDAYRCRISGNQLNESVPEDLAMFTNLKDIDAEENLLSLEAFVPFPSLSRLNLASNGLFTLDARTITSTAFTCLKSINLGFNTVDAMGILALAGLPGLENLDLTGNELHFLPKLNQGHFPHLTDLSLHMNRLQADALAVLSALPKLRTLNLRRNAIKCKLLADFDSEQADDSADKMENIFPELETINLAENHICSERDLLPLMRCQKLCKLEIWGNPIASKYKGTPPMLKALLLERMEAMTVVKTEPVRLTRLPVLLDINTLATVKSTLNRRTKYSIVDALPPLAPANNGHPPKSYQQTFLATDDENYMTIVTDATANQAATDTAASENSADGVFLTQVGCDGNDYDEDIRSADTFPFGADVDYGLHPSNAPAPVTNRVDSGAAKVFLGRGKQGDENPDGIKEKLAGCDPMPHRDIISSVKALRYILNKPLTYYNVKSSNIDYEKAHQHSINRQPKKMQNKCAKADPSRTANMVMDGFRERKVVVESDLADKDNAVAVLYFQRAQQRFEKARDDLFEGIQLDGATETNVHAPMQQRQKPARPLTRPTLTPDDSNHMVR